MEFTARMIADLLGGHIEGDENISVNSFAKIEEGKPGALSFLANPKYIHYIYDSRSSIILVSNDFIPEKTVNATLIRVEDPYNAISLLLEKVNEVLNPHPTRIEHPNFISEDVNIPENCYIGAFVYIGKNVKLGDGVKIYPHSYVGDGVCIEDNTVVYAGVKIYPGIRIGKNCIIHSGAVIGADGFGFAPQSDGSYRKIPQLGIVEIADNVEIGANTTIDRATMGSTYVGHGTKLDNLIQLAHNVTIGKNTVIASQTGVAGSTHIGDNCVFAGQVGVAGHLRIGNRVTVGAQSGIPNDVSSDNTVMGYPAVPGRNFARQTALIRRLSNLFDRVAKLEKESL